MSRSRNAILNSGTRLMYEIVAIVCSFILPRLLLSFYGSDVNGLVLSITRFLSISTFIDAAIGGVTRAAMYKPLAEKNYGLLSKIFKESNSFYWKVSKIFIAYTLFVAVILPFINSEGFSFWDIFSLTFAIALSTYIQFLIGATNNVLVYADQKVYLISLINTGTLILNTIATVVLIKLGCSIQIVKLTTSIIFAIRPIFTFIYCRKKYPIDKNVQIEKNLIPNKWSGFSHQISETIRNNADTVILTCLSVYSSVSIYAIYALVTEGLTKLLECVKTGMGPSFGNMLVTETVDKVRIKYSLLDWIINLGSCILFTSAILLIVPFVMLFTYGVVDAEYNQPLFAFLIVYSTLLNNMKNPYLMLIFAAGHFKETQNSAIVEMFLNVCFSVFFVYKFGLNGVAIGAIVAMLYRVIYCAIYLKDNIVFYSPWNLLKKISINSMFLVLAFVIYLNYDFTQINSFDDWILYAIVVFVITTTASVVVYSFLFKQDYREFVKFFCSNICRKQP